MKKEVAQKLKTKAEEIATNFSRDDRAYNFSGETFSVSLIIPLSENTAAVLFDKSSGKQAVAFCYYIAMNNGTWQYFFPTDSHVLGMAGLADILRGVEKFNFELN